jgi:hypothetical protein
MVDSGLRHDLSGAAMALALALTLGTLAWIVDQGVGYPLVKVVCANGEKSLLTAVSASALMMALLGCALGVRARRLERHRFLATIAIGFNALVLLFVMMTAVFPFLLHPCE